MFYFALWASVFHTIWNSKFKLWLSFDFSPYSFFFFYNIAISVVKIEINDFGRATNVPFKARSFNDMNINY